MLNSIQTLFKINNPKFQTLTVRNNGLRKLTFVHVGKCGGISVWNALKQSSFIKDKYYELTRVHISKPVIRKDVDYIIVLRNPVLRSISAFNWRKQLTEKSFIQSLRFPGEVPALNSFSSFEEMCIHLFDEFQLPNIRVHKMLKRIHHFEYNISYYLADLLESVDPSQIAFVFNTEQLSDQLKVSLRINSVDHIHSNSQVSQNNFMSLRACNSLAKFLEEDYLAIQRLHTLFPLASDQYANLMEYAPFPVKI